MNESRQKQLFTARAFEQRLQRSRSYFVAGDAAETPRGCGERKHASATYTHSSKDKYTAGDARAGEHRRCIAVHTVKFARKKLSKEDARLLLTCSERHNHTQHPSNCLITP